MNEEKKAEVKETEQEKKPYLRPELEEPKEIRSFCATDLQV